VLFAAFQIPTAFLETVGALQGVVRQGLVAHLELIAVAKLLLLLF